MRDVFKNPVFYYVLAPILVGLWPLLVWGMYLPKAEKAWEDDRKLYNEAKTSIVEILEKDPDRLKIAAESKSLGRFTYAEAVDRVANLCRIPSSNYTLSTGIPVTSGGKESQQARVNLVDVSIVQGAKFLSTIHSMWVNLNCDRIRLTKKPGMPDRWDMDLTFQYSY
jgi:hypothetical protein